MTLECKAPNLFAGESSAASSPSKAEVTRFRDKLAKLLKSNARETMTITPMMADVMLEYNTGNRTLSKARAAKYAKDMARDAWQRTGEPIIFSDAGILNDGQTRLRACIQAGSSFLTDVTFGIPRKAFEVTGIGAKRSLADVFSINGEAYSIKLAGALNWLNGYLNGFAGPKLAHVDGIALLDLHPDIRKSIEPGRLMYQQTHLMEPSLAIFLHYIFALIDLDKADAFLEFLTDGIGANGKTDPRHVLRERLIANKGDKAKLPPLDIAALTIKSWNTFRKGQQMRSLRWMTNPAKGTPEAFPRAL